MAIERDHLAQLLLVDREAGRAARDALASGAAFDVWPGDAPTRELVSIYARRCRHCVRVGQESIGFAQAVDDLRAFTGDRLAIGYVDDRNASEFYYQLFLTPDGTRVVACLGVRVTRCPGLPDR